jgi:cytochrome c553
MKYRLFALSVALGLLPAVSTQTAEAGDPEAGRLKASMCQGCHGIPGYRNAYPAYHVPKLGGQHAAYLVSALKAYRSGERSHPTMRAIAASLSDQDIADLAAYFSAPPKEKETKP